MVNGFIEGKKQSSDKEKYFAFFAPEPTPTAEKKLMLKPGNMFYLHLLVRFIITQDMNERFGESFRRNILMSLL